MRKMGIKDYQDSVKAEREKGRENGHEPDQGEIPGTEHQPSAIELKIKPYALDVAKKRKAYQKAGMEAKEALDALKAVIKFQGVEGQIVNCGGGVVIRPKVKETLEIETPDGISFDEESAQTELDEEIDDAA